MSQEPINHYEYLDKYLADIFKSIGIKQEATGLGSAHGDKYYSAETIWKKNGIPFNHGMVMAMISRCHPYSNEVRETSNGWVDVNKWIVTNYPRFKHHFP